MANRPTVVPDEAVEEPQDPTVKTFHIRGHEYKVREIKGNEYEEQFRAATTELEDGRQSTDLFLLDKLLTVMVVKRDGEPLTLEFFDDEVYPVTQKVTRVAKEHTWLFEVETDEEKADREKAEAEAAKGKKGPNS